MKRGRPGAPTSLAHPHTPPGTNACPFCILNVPQIRLLLAASPTPPPYKFPRPPCLLTAARRGLPKGKSGSALVPLAPDSVPGGNRAWECRLEPEKREAPQPWAFSISESRGCPPGAGAATNISGLSHPQQRGLCTHIHISPTTQAHTDMCMLKTSHTHKSSNTCARVLDASAGTHAELRHKDAHRQVKGMRFQALKYVWQEYQLNSWWLTTLVQACWRGLAGKQPNVNTGLIIGTARHAHTVTQVHTHIHIHKHTLAFALMHMHAHGHAHTHPFTHTHMHTPSSRAPACTSRHEQEGSWSTCPREGSAPTGWKRQRLHLGPSRASTWVAPNLCAAKEWILGAPRKGESKCPLQTRGDSGRAKASSSPHLSQCLTQCG